MNDESVLAALGGFLVSVLLVILGLVVTGRLFPVIALVGLLVTVGAVIAASAAWSAWLRGDRHKLATQIRRQSAELAHRKAETLLALELEQARHDHGRARATVTRIQDAADQRLIGSLHLDTQLGTGTDSGSVLDCESGL